MARRKIAYFVVPALLALAFRFCGLTFDSFWLDEGYQTIIGAYGQPVPAYLKMPVAPFLYKSGQPKSPDAMIYNFRRVDPLTPPLYQLLLNYWVRAWGGSDFAVRSLSALLSSLAVPVTEALAFVLLGWRGAICAALLQAFSPFAVYYGHEARMYALEELMAVLSMGSLALYLFPSFALRLHIGGAARRFLLLLYSVATWALINTHYTGLFLFASQIVLSIFVSVRRRSYPLAVSLLFAYVLVAIMWLPWFNMFVEAASIRTAAFYVARQPSVWWPVMALLLRIPANWVMFLSGNQVVAPALPLLGSSAILLLLAGCWMLAPDAMAKAKHRSGQAAPAARRTADSDLCDRQSSLLLWFWAIAPAIILWAFDVAENHRVIELPRYLIATAPAIYILAAGGLSWLAQRRLKLACILLGAQLLFAGINNIAHATIVHQKEPWRQMAALVERTVPSSELLLISQYYDISCLDRYLNCPYRQVGVSSVTTGPQLAAVLAGSDHFALVTAQEGDRVVRVIPSVYRVDRDVDLGHSLHLFLFSNARADR